MDQDNVKILSNIELEELKDSGKLVNLELKKS